MVRSLLVTREQMVFYKHIHNKPRNYIENVGNRLRLHSMFNGGTDLLDEKRGFNLPRRLITDEKKQISINRSTGKRLQKACSVTRFSC